MALDFEWVQQSPTCAPVSYLCAVALEAAVQHAVQWLEAVRLETGEAGAAQDVAARRAILSRVRDFVDALLVRGVRASATRRRYGQFVVARFVLPAVVQRAVLYHSLQSSVWELQLTLGTAPSLLSRATSVSSQTSTKAAAPDLLSFASGRIRSALQREETIRTSPIHRHLLPPSPCSTVTHICAFHLLCLWVQWVRTGLICPKAQWRVR